MIPAYYFLAFPTEAVVSQRTGSTIPFEMPNSFATRELLVSYSQEESETVGHTIRGGVRPHCNDQARLLSETGKLQGTFTHAEMENVPHVNEYHFLLEK